MIKLSLLALFFTIPFFGSGIYYGVPLWVYISLGATLAYVVILLFIIEQRYHTLKDEHD